MSRKHTNLNHYRWVGSLSRLENSKAFLTRVGELEASETQARGSVHKWKYGSKQRQADDTTMLGHSRFDEEVDYHIDVFLAEVHQRSCHHDTVFVL